MKKSILLAGALTLLTPLHAQLSKINFDKGVIAYSADGNKHDEDDWGANALNIVMLHYAGLEDKLVHYDFNDHLFASQNEQWASENAISIREGMDRFWGDKAEAGKALTYDCLVPAEYEAAIANFVLQAKKCNADNPMWYICAGPMEMPWRCLKALKEEAPEQLKYVHWISHSYWNNHHGSGDTCAENSHGINELKADFPEVNYHDIKDQNSSNGKLDFNDETDGKNWQWLLNAENSNDDWKWLYYRDKKANVFDVSDAGMVWWLITGGIDGGQEDGGAREIKAFMGAIDGDPTTELDPTPAAGDPYISTSASIVGDGQYLSQNGYVVFEAESTTSPLDKWLLVGEGDANYQEGASGLKHLEFNANQPNGGAAASPLEYTFKVPNDGTYQVFIRTYNRLVDAPKDDCNEAFLRIEGGAVSASMNGNGSLSDSQIAKNAKIYGGGESDWGWNYSYQVANNSKVPIRFTLKAGVEYKMVISGAALRYNFDFVTLYDMAQYDEKSAPQIGPAGVKEEATSIISSKVCGAVAVAAVDGGVVIRNAMGSCVQLFSATGVAVATTIPADDHTFIALERGIYIVYLPATATSYKVVVE